MGRLTWLVLALVLLLGGVYMHVHQFEWLAYLIAGVGAGIGLAWTGSVIHDAFAGQRERR